MGWKWAATGRHRKGSSASLLDVPIEARRQDPLIVVCPGRVVSKMDGDEHIIGFGQLCQLYGVNPRMVLNEAHPATSSMVRYRSDLGDQIIWLRPLYEGNYDFMRLVHGLNVLECSQ